MKSFKLDLKKIAKSRKSLYSFLIVASLLVFAGAVYAGVYNPAGNCSSTAHTSACYKAPGSEASPASPNVQVTESYTNPTRAFNFCAKNLNPKDILIPSNTANELSLFKAAHPSVTITEGTCSTCESGAFGISSSGPGSQAYQNGTGGAVYDLRADIDSQNLLPAVKTEFKSKTSQINWPPTNAAGTRIQDIPTIYGPIHSEATITSAPGGGGSAGLGYDAEVEWTYPTSQNFCEGGEVTANWYLHSGGSANIISCLIDGCQFGSSNTGPIRTVISNHSQWSYLTQANANAVVARLRNNFPVPCDVETDNQCPSGNNGAHGIKSGTYSVNNGAISSEFGTGPGQKFNWSTGRWNLTEGSLSCDLQGQNCMPGVQYNAGITISDPY